MAINGGTGNPIANYEEHGRVYGGFRRGMYLMPCDETEKDRLDIMHHLILIARNERLINAPFVQRPAAGLNDRCRVLDLGCGTGIWLLDMAQKFPETEFVGVDISGMGPETLLPNVELRWPCDYESPWSFGEHAWDVIHLQMGLGSVSNWPNLYAKVLNHLRPGIGWLEQVEVDLTPRVGDGTVREGPLRTWYQSLIGATQSTHRGVEYNPQTGQMLRDAGFTDIREEVRILPLNPWAADEREHQIGLWYQIALSEGVRHSGGFGLEAMCLAPFTRIYRWPVDHVRRLCADALGQLCDANVHAYNRLHIWSARAPYLNETR